MYNLSQLALIVILLVIHIICHLSQISFIVVVLVVQLIPTLLQISLVLMLPGSYPYCYVISLYPVRIIVSVILICIFVT